MQATPSAPEPSQGRLTPHEQAFVHAFLKTGNAAEAYRLAYPNASPKTPKKAGDKAYAIRQRPQVASAIEEALRKAQGKAELSAQEVIEGLRENAHDAKRCVPPQFSASNHAYELLARKVVPEIGGGRIEHTGAIEHFIRDPRFAQYTTEELEAFVEQYRDTRKATPAEWRELPEGGAVEDQQASEPGENAVEA